MAARTAEQAVRREAIRRRLQGERPCEICHDFPRSDSGLAKWWPHYQHQPQSDFAARSRAPHTSPRQPLPAVEHALLMLRQPLTAGQSPTTRYGLIGQRAIRAELERLGLSPLPSLATIERILARHGLTQPRGAGAPQAYYPEPGAQAPNALHATHSITRHLTGGQVVQNLHTFDHYSHTGHLSQQPDKSCCAIRAPLLGTWGHLALPRRQPLDNEAPFHGGHSHPRVLGQVVRPCRVVGTAVGSSPEDEAKRTHWVEGFHALWVQAFWDRDHFGDLAQVRRQVPLFWRWYHHCYRPPSLGTTTPAQMRQGWPLVRLPPASRQLIPARLPVTARHINLLRQGDSCATVNVLNEPWTVGRKWCGQYVWVRVDTGHHTLTTWHQPGQLAPWQQLKTRAYCLYEPVQPLLPQFRRNRPRCREHWPG